MGFPGRYLRSNPHQRFARGFPRDSPELEGKVASWAEFGRIYVENPPEMGICDESERLIQVPQRADTSASGWRIHHYGPRHRAKHRDDCRTHVTNTANPSLQYSEKIFASEKLPGCMQICVTPDISIYSTGCLTRQISTDRALFSRWITGYPASGLVLMRMVYG